MFLKCSAVNCWPFIELPFRNCTGNRKVVGAPLSSLSNIQNLVAYECGDMVIFVEF